VRERHCQRVGDQLGAHVIGHRPANDPPRVKILDGDEVEPAFPGSEVGDVGDPAAVRGAGGEIAIEQILSDADAGHTDRRRPVLLGLQPRQAGLAHQALDAFAADLLAVVDDEIAPDARRAIDLAPQGEQLADAGGQAGVLERPRRRRSADPGVKARAADLQHAAHDLDRVLGPLRRDEPEDPHRVPLSLAKKAAADL